MIPPDVWRRNDLPTSASTARSHSSRSNPQSRMAWVIVNRKPGISRNSPQMRHSRGSRSIEGEACKTRAESNPKAQKAARGEKDWREGMK